MASVYRIFEGNFASIEAFQSTASGSYVTSMVDSSPVDVNIIIDREDNGDVIVKWVFSNEEDREVFFDFARGGDTDPAVVGVGQSSFPGRSFNI